MDTEDSSSPLLPEAEFTEPVNHRKPEAKDQLLCRTKNLALNLVLLVGCYSAILIPAFLPSDMPTATNDSQAGDLVLLNQSATLLSRPCQPGWSLDHVSSLPCSTGLLDIPVFLQQVDRPWELPPPLGFQGSEERVTLALGSLPHPGMPPSLGRQGSCRRCVVVGSGGVLHGSHLGSHIDQYDVIIRMNNAPVSGFERDTGSRTTIRLMYPEGAPHSPRDYKDTSLVTLVVFKSLDLDWLTSVISKQPLTWWSKLWFWREVVENIPLRPENFRILNPEIIHKTGLMLQSYTQQQRTISVCPDQNIPPQMVPTLGASAVVMALQLCDQVSLAGFGYNLHDPGARLHYYESLRMDAIKAQVVHDISAEKLFLRELVAAGAVTDLTGAL